MQPNTTVPGADGLWAEWVSESGQGHMFSLNSIGFCCCQTQNTGLNRPPIQPIDFCCVFMFSIGRSFFLLGRIYKPWSTQHLWNLMSSATLYSGLLVTVLPCFHLHLLCRASFHCSETVIKRRGWVPGHLTSSPLHQGIPNSTIFILG